MPPHNLIPRRHTMVTRSSSRKVKPQSVKGGQDPVEANDGFERMRKRFSTLGMGLVTEPSEQQATVEETLVDPKSLRTATIESKPLEQLYTDLQRISQGKFGVVYRGHRLSDQKLVAIKQIPIRFDDRDEKLKYVEKVQREIDIATQLSNACQESAEECGIVKTYRAFVDPYMHDFNIEMEYIEGGTGLDFARHLQTLRVKPRVQLFVGTFLKLIRNLKMIHENGILHRDIKPVNLLYDRAKQRLVFADFGISCVVNSAECERPAGTPASGDPSIILTFRYTDVFSDVYSMGLTLYELLFNVQFEYVHEVKGLQYNYARAMDVIDTFRCANSYMRNDTQEFVVLESIKRMMHPFIIEQRPSLNNILRAVGYKTTDNATPRYDWGYLVHQDIKERVEEPESPTTA